jgi:hypothetical protein
VGLLKVGQFRAGDCLAGSNLPLGTNNNWPVYTSAVPCGQSHIGEVFFADNHYWRTGGAYPGDNAINNQANTECDKAYTAYVGIPDASSIYTWDNIFPTSDSWRTGDRTLDCIAYHATAGNPDGTPLSASIKGSRR